ncbi:MAG: transaldolase family protein [Candidatus Paracaedibacteraceae bacterium]|nr:transaldolase family protein [Candidatus Paracaedibacteraceae bacterium]
MKQHIYLVAPSYPISQQVVDLAGLHLEKLGFHVTVPPDLLGDDLIMCK